MLVLILPYARSSSAEASAAPEAPSSAAEAAAGDPALAWGAGHHEWVEVDRHRPARVKVAVPQYSQSD